MFDSLIWFHKFKVDLKSFLNGNISSNNVCWSDGRWIIRIALGASYKRFNFSLRLIPPKKTVCFWLMRNGDVFNCMRYQKLRGIKVNLLGLTKVWNNPIKNTEKRSFRFQVPSRSILQKCGKVKLGNSYATNFRVRTKKLK